MSGRSKKSGAKRARERSTVLRRELREKRALPRSVPDLRDPRVRADLRRQGKLLAQHPENDAIDAWIEAVYDSSAWK